MQSVVEVLIMAPYFVALLVLCVSGSSLGTTTKPQQQNTLKDLRQKSVMSHGFPGIPGSNGMPGMPGVPGPQGPQGREGAKGQTGDKGTQGMMGSKGERGREGSHGKSGSPGMMGIKGEPGFVGAAGRKGDKGEKGGSEKARPASPVPQTNWKQCVWKHDGGTSNGKIKCCWFNKLQNDTALKVSFQGVMSVRGSSKCNRWYFKFNNNECSGPMTIEAEMYNYWPSGSPHLLHHRSFEGCCENLPRGMVGVELWIGKCVSYPLGSAGTGWNSVTRIMIEEVSRPQS